MGKCCPFTGFLGNPDCWERLSVKDNLLLSSYQLSPFQGPHSIPIWIWRILHECLTAGQEDSTERIDLGTLAKEVTGSGEVLLPIGFYALEKMFLAFRELVVRISEYFDEFDRIFSSRNQNSIGRVTKCLPSS